MKINIYTDGASRGNPGNGGWGVYIEVEKKIDQKIYTQKIGGNEKNTTNNKMELLAVLEALKYLKKNLKKIFDSQDLKDLKNKLEIILHLDSEYVRKGITEWIKNWVKNNWKNSSKKEVVNKNIWQEILKYKDDINKNLLEKKYPEIKWNYVAGHTGIKGNEIADEIATSFADRLK